MPNVQALLRAREIQRLSNQADNVSGVENDDQQKAKRIDLFGKTFDDPISEEESRHISASVTSALLLNVRQTSLSELLAGVSRISDAACVTGGFE